MCEQTKTKGYKLNPTISNYEQLDGQRLSDEFHRFEREEFPMQCPYCQSYAKMSGLNLLGKNDIELLCQRCGMSFALISAGKFLRDIATRGKVF